MNNDTQNLDQQLGFYRKILRKNHSDVCYLTLNYCLHEYCVLVHQHKHSFGNSVTASKRFAEVEQKNSLHPAQVSRVVAISQGYNAHANKFSFTRKFTAHKILVTENGKSTSV